VFQSTRPHGARLLNIAGYDVKVEFQSTRPHGARPKPYGIKVLAEVFQSTRPHGARRGFRRFGRRSRYCFNPHAHTGRDTIPKQTHITLMWFQSTRPHGARQLYTSQPVSVRTVSIHTPTRGATINASIRNESKLVSIHTPTRGATLAMF